MTIWKYSWRDGFLLAATAMQMFVNIWVAATWNERTVLQLFLLWPAAVAMFWYNPMVATHNFLHTPWFKSELANRVYAAVNSINLGIPQILCRFHHLNHHRYGNDRKGANGLTKDHSSTYAFGKGGQHENVLTYCAMGLIRGGIAQAYREAQGERHSKQFRVELIVCVLGLAGYLVLSWQYVLFFFVPVFYVGSFLGTLTNYYQHFGASPGNRSGNSVSYYGRVYNALFCNEGYHQEHHLRPQVHWTQRPQVRQELFRGAGRREVPTAVGIP